MTVSYTHLRAHETEADLVCRLLLEKKKEKKKNLSVLRLVLFYEKERPGVEVD